MNRLVAFILSLALITTAVSCKKETDLLSPDQPDTGTPSPPATESITPVGTPQGPAVTAIIGPAGGIIASADERIRITIPAGALTADKTISVQPLNENNCPAGTGQAFRLLPHGLTFAKPATITFQYDEQDIDGSAPELLRVAYQTNEGYWQSPATKRVDTATRTVLVKTTHFSDWGVFQNMYIGPPNSSLAPGGQVHFDLYEQISSPEPATDDDLYVPAAPQHIDASLVERWTFSGEGRLIHGLVTGDYYAPDKIPADNPEVVTVLLNKSVTIDGQVFRDIRLVANMFIAPEGLSVQIDGGNWQTYTGGFTFDGQRNILLGRSGTELASVQWTGNPTGMYQWTMNTDVIFSLNKGKLIYQNRYGTAPSVSGGSLRVSRDGEWIVGKFTVQPAGWTNSGIASITYGTASIKGVFRMKSI